MGFYEGDPGLHLEAVTGIQGKNISFGVPTNFVRIPKANLTNWSVVGMQLIAGPHDRNVSPYFLVGFGLINVFYKDESVNLRTGTFDLGGGIRKNLNDSKALLFDIRWKRFFDYKAEDPSFTIWNYSLGIAF